ncbi:MAG: DNA methyltransferase [Gammaproteobacteria bacterium]|nr:DNA methyltransferase [Gammaproteobacteria bacterium]
MTDCNILSRTIFCHDNLDVLRGMNSECIDLIYLDPPFNKNKKFAAPTGSSAEGAEFSDIFRQEDVKDEWLATIKEDEPELYTYLNGIKGVGKPYSFAYLANMAIRLIECRRVLKNTGSIYFHCDSTMSHYLKSLMDCSFGEKNFRSHVIWRRVNPTGRGSKRYANNADHILYYSISMGPTFVWNQPYKVHDGEYVQKTYRHIDKDGRRYRLDNLKGAGVTKTGSLGRSWRDVDPSDSGSHCAVPGRILPDYMKKRSAQEKLDYLDEIGRIYWPPNGKVPQYKRYLDEMQGTPVDTIWDDIGGLQSQDGERTGYPTQKPVALLERIIKASSNEEDIVLHPFCGCAMTCVAAEHLNRQWIGVDISIIAYDLVRDRLSEEVANPGNVLQFRNRVHLKTDPPRRTDLGADYRERKFVYVISHLAYPGEYKVGIARNWQSRLVAYQTSDPGRQYRIEYRLETPDFRELEKHIHKTFPNKHEWVQGDLREIIKAIREYKPREQT